jgi:hypothetical protein
MSDARVVATLRRCPDRLPMSFVEDVIRRRSGSTRRTHNA